MHNIISCTQKFLICLAALLLAPSAMAACYITGCNGEVCASDPEQHFGICEWKIEDQCYQEHGVCQEDENGICGWVQSPELLQCITNMQQVNPGGLQQNVEQNDRDY